MKASTHSWLLTARKEKVFAFLSNIENLPKWATLFCLELKRDAQGRCKVVTPEGEFFFRIEADARTGVVDMFGGPSEDRMACWPARVVERPGNGSLFIFTALQYPGVSDEAFKAQCASLEHELPNIERHTAER